MRQIHPPEIISGLTNEEYHGGPGISRSGLWTLWNQSPNHYMNGEREQTKSLRLGTLAHTATLEPERFAKEYQRGEPLNKNSNAWKDAVKIAAEGGVTLCDGKEYDAACRIADRIHADTVFKSILNAKPKIEDSAYWEDGETLCRCRPDAAIPGLLLDLKSCASAAGDKPLKAIQDYGYWTEAPFYIDGWAAAGGGECAFLFLFVEPAEPTEYRWLELDGQFLANGRTFYKRALEKYRECLRRNVWPGYSKAVETVNPQNWFQLKFNQEFSSNV